MPNTSRITFTMPNWSLNIQRIMMAAMTGATISGSRMMVCTSQRPGNLRLSSSAISRPRISEQPTLANMKPNVFGSTVRRKSPSRRT